MKKASFKILCVGFAILICLPGFYFPTARASQEEHEVVVRLIHVDVIVKKDGKFVSDLTREDFEIYEDGKRISINSFELLSFGKSELETAEAEKETPSARIQKNKLVVIFDGINTWQPDFVRCSPKIKVELMSFASSGNEVMVLHLSKQPGLKTLQTFTSDKQLLSSAIDSVAGNKWRTGRDTDKLVELLENAKKDAPNAAAAASIEETLAQVEEHTILDFLYLEKQKFETTLGGLLAAFNVVKHIPGRKSVLLVSDGLPELHSANPEVIRRQIARGRGSKAVFDALSPRGTKIGKVRVFDPLNLLEKKDFKTGEEAIEEVIRYANSHNISVYSFDPAPFSREQNAANAAEYQTRDAVPFIRFLKQEKMMKVQNLEFLSKETSAITMRGAKKYDQFRQVLNEDLASYYLLSFYPRKGDPDGKFHDIKVKVKRKGVKVQYRKGYTDYTEQEEVKIRLVSAFYNPSFYKELPFNAEFIPFYTDSGDCIPWMVISLPTKEFFVDRFIDYSQKIYTFHIWMKERRGEKMYGGQFNIPIKISEPFMRRIKTMDNLRLFFRGPELSFGKEEVHVIYSLSDPDTKEIGTWDSSFVPRRIKGEKDSIILNCVSGNYVSDANETQKSVSISNKDGSLEFGQAKFYPNIKARFKKWNGMYVFLQAYLPEGKDNMTFYFSLLGEDRHVHSLSRDLVAESWIDESKIWNGIFFLDIIKGSFGENSLIVEISNSVTKSVLSRELKLTILQ